LAAGSIWDEATLRNRIAERAFVYFPELRGTAHVRISQNLQRAYSEIYEVEIADDQRVCRRVIVKKARSARREYDELLLLWQSFSHHSGYGVARPLDYLEDGPALFMEAVSGSSLQAIFPRWYWRSASLSVAKSACQKAGKWLALYHQIPPITLPVPLDLDRKLTDFERTWNDLAAVGFSLRACEQISGRVVSTRKRLNPESFVNVRVHGDFSIDNIWLDGDKLVVLDISGVRSNARELDIAAFLNSLLLIRFCGWMPMHVFRSLRRAFFRGYGDQAPIDPVAVNFFQATGMLDAIWELWERRPGPLTRVLSRPVLTGLAEILDERFAD